MSTDTPITPAADAATARVGRKIAQVGLELLVGRSGPGLPLRLLEAAAICRQLAEEAD